jgi:tetratricopeptide (TPR) repeat protein
MPKALGGLPEADALRKAGKYEEAIAEYKKVLAAKADDLAALYGLSYAYTLQGKDSQYSDVLWNADKPLQKLVALAPDVAEYRFLRGWHAYLLAPKAPSFYAPLLKTAETELELATRLKTDYLFALMYLAMTREKRGKWETAAQAYRQTLALDPAQKTLYYPLAECYYRARRYAESAGAARIGIAKNSTDARLFPLLGNACLAQGDPAGAERAFLDGIERNPSDAGLYKSLLTALRDPRHPGANAEAVFADLAKKHGAFGHAIIYHVILLREAKKPKEALAELRGICENEKMPLREWIWLWIGQLETELGRPEKGYDAYLRSLAARKNFSNAFVPLRSRFIELRDQKKYALAADFLRRVSATEPMTEIWAWVEFELGANLQDLGDHAGTVAAWKRAAELDPAEPRFENSLGLEFRARGNLEKACRHFRKGMEKVIDYMYSMENLAVTLIPLGRIDQAKEMMMRGVDTAQVQFLLEDDPGTKAERKFDIFKFKYFLAELREAELAGGK